MPPIKKMPEEKDKNSEENAWKNYLSSIEKKPQKPAKKGVSIGQRFKIFLKKVGIGKSKKGSGEEIKKQIEISAKEARERTATAITKKRAAGKSSYDKPAAKSIYEKKPSYEKPTIATKPIFEKLKGKISEKKEKKPALKIEKGYVDKKSFPSRMEKYISKIEEKQAEKKKVETFEKLLEEKRIEEKQKERKKVEKFEKLLEEKRIAEEKKKRFVKKAGKAIPKKISKTVKKKKEKKEYGVSKKISFMPKVKKKKAAKEKKTNAVPLTKVKQEEAEREKTVKAFFKEEPSIAKKSVEEIKKLTPKQIKKEVNNEKIEKKARGWYGDSLKHKKAAVSGWRLRKKIKLHQLKKKEKTKPLTAKEKKAKKKLIYEDRELRLKVQELDQKIKSLKKISKKKNKESKDFEKKIKAVGIKISKGEIKGVEKVEVAPTRKEDMRQVVGVMKKIASEMAMAASSQKFPTIGKKDATAPIEDLIKAREKLIKNLERAFYKRKIDFNQFREKMFDYQSKLTELKINKKMRDERIANMSPEERQLMKEQAAGKKKITGVGLTQKTAEALEKMTTEKQKKGLEEKTAEAIKKLSEKETERGGRETEEKKFVKKTASALEKIATKLGSVREKPYRATGRIPTAKSKEIVSKARPVQPQTIYTGPVYVGPGQAPRAPITTRPTIVKGRNKKKGAKAQPMQRAPPYTGQGYSGQVQPYPAPPAYVPTAGKKVKGKRTMIGVTPQATAEQETAYQRQFEHPERRMKGMPKPAADFYDKEPVRKKGFLGKLKERVAYGKKPVAKEVNRAVREKISDASTSISKKQVDEVEQKLSNLVKKYNIPKQTMEAHIKTLDSNRLLSDFHKLINLIETKKGLKTNGIIKPATGFDINAGVISKKKERLVGKEKEIRRARIETSFDRVLTLVQLKGIINVKDAAQQLGMKKKELQDCAEILERSNLIKLNYPPIGPIKLIYPDYLKWKIAEKKKKREMKKKKKGL